MALFSDLTGKKFGEWEVVGWAEKKYTEQFWLCKCSCGKEKVVRGASLKTGTSKSCGCKGHDWCRTHGMEGTSIYNTWAGMLQRCNNKNYHQFHHYGGRGITVCDEWRKFETFYADMGGRPEGRSLDRIDNDGNYCKDNCRWATKKEQIRNRRTSTFLTYKGQTLSVSGWAEELGIKRKCLERRIRDGWPTEKALTTPKSGRWGIINA